MTWAHEDPSTPREGDRVRHDAGGTGVLLQALYDEEQGLYSGRVQWDAGDVTTVPLPELHKEQG